MRLLIVEDKVKMAGLLRRAMRSEGFATDVTGCGEDALWMAGSTRYDAIVLDVMLPGIDGFETCRRMRADEIWTPVLMLTARSSLEDRVAGLDGGADDYLLKPFEVQELAARLRALIRRRPPVRPAVLQVGDLQLDPATQRVWQDGVAVTLPGKCLALLHAFMRRPGDVLSRFELLEAAWDGAYENRSNVVDQHVRMLRERIGSDSIETVRGRGYRLRESVRC